jgi:hypothetical protein
MNRNDYLGARHVVRSLAKLSQISEREPELAAVGLRLYRILLPAYDRADLTTYMSLAYAPAQVELSTLEPTARKRLMLRRIEWREAGLLRTERPRLP